MMDKKKKKEFKFFWEGPKRMEKGMREGLKFAFPRFEMLEIRNLVPVNIGETEKEMIVRVELPGFKKDEINLNITEDSIEINAAKKEEKIEEPKEELIEEVEKELEEEPEKVTEEPELKEIVEKLDKIKGKKRRY